MTELAAPIQEIESRIFDWESDQLDTDAARREIRDFLQELAQISLDQTLSLADTFAAISHGRAAETRRDMAMVIIRLMCRPGLIPRSGLEKARRDIVNIVETGFPNFLGSSSPRKAQTHEKLDAIGEIHTKACERLQHLRKPFGTLQNLAGRRQTILRDLNHGPTKEYLNTFGFTAAYVSVASVLKMADDVVNSEGRSLQTSMQHLLESVEDEIIHYEAVTSFVSRHYIIPFLKAVQINAMELQATLSDRFDCRITVPSGSLDLEKKYPLHNIGSKVQIALHLINEGPGAAQNVRALCMATHCRVHTEETNLGDVEPGPFVLTLLLDVTSSREHLDLDVIIDWGVVGVATRRNEDFSLRVQGQRTDIDWESLAQQPPYSLDVAYDADFYGRDDALRRCLGRLIASSMQSCYITGQKRVGKTSLARAIQTQIVGNSELEDYFVLYLECGEVRHSTGPDTLKAFGARLEEFLLGALPPTGEWTARDFSTSLSPVTRLLDYIFEVRPTARFVVVFDEFDEINEDLYRHGDLADTFFLNLRTISSKRNIAFVLVGAERMPYVMASQGDKLNRFERESLNRFDKAEWADFRSMIQSPVEPNITFHESAIRKIFDLTDGHPYFTKMLCAKIYERASNFKDAEVSNTDASSAAEIVVADLDINVFAHYWRDGIRGDADEVEIVSLKRRRLLVAWARTARSGAFLTFGAIQSNVRSPFLSDDEVLPLLEDFCRRQVFQERDECFFPTVLLLATWLKEDGFSKLISDRLGDELAEAKQRREDAAYVQSAEIVAVADRWHLYQGLQITEERIRAWIEQVESNVDRRLLFKVVENVRFYSELEIRASFTNAHRRIRDQLPVYTKTRRSQRRTDIFVSYVDGPGKSGSFFASLYASANGLASGNVVEPMALRKTLSKLDDEQKVGLVIVDDMIGTGNGLVKNLSARFDDFQRSGVGTDIPLSVVVVCGTKEGESRVRKHLQRTVENSDLEVCEHLDDSHSAFAATGGVWESQEEMSVAKSLIRDIGTRVLRRRPLGYGDQGLLLVFPRNCPNNSLPILHGSGKGDNKWIPLFPRARA